MPFVRKMLIYQHLYEKEMIFIIDNFERLYLGVCNIYKDIQKIKKSEMSFFGLSGKHVMPFYYLMSHPEGLTASEICRLSNADKAGVSRSLKEMESEGYILYEENSEKKRYRSKIYLTAEGRKKGKQIRNIILQLTMESGQELSSEERETFYRVLDILSENIHSICEKANEENTI
ncbi:MAG: helix-turn-helix domain-containing protein [Eubacteriales bacterium]|nr:helix-turn-helix domain-containing protein [Eubacteriales bacterium]